MRAELDRCCFRRSSWKSSCHCRNPEEVSCRQCYRPPLGRPIPPMKILLSETGHVSELFDWHFICSKRHVTPRASRSNKSQTPSFLGRCSVRSISRACFTSALTVLIVSLSATGRASETSVAVAGSASSSSDAISIDNFGRVSATYYRGAQPNGRDYANLATVGIKTVIDRQLDGDKGERQLVESAGMKFYRIPMTTHEPPTREQLAQFLQLVNDPANQPVYVHCAGGRHRTGVM